MTTTKPLWLTNPGVGERAPKPLLAGSVVLYGASLLLPAMYTADGAVPAIEVLEFGWLGILEFRPAWYANPAYLATLVWISRNKLPRAQKAAALAVVLSSTSWLAPGWPAEQGELRLVDVSALGSGYYVWSLSILLLFGAATLMVNRARESAREMPPDSA